MGEKVRLFVQFEFCLSVLSDLMRVTRMNICWGFYMLFEWTYPSVCYRIFISKLKSLILCRLHVFGRDSTIRPGWLTVGPELTNSNFNAELYASYFTNGQATTGCTERIEALRPKSPPPKGKGAPGGRGRGGPSRGGFSRGRGRGR